MTHPLEKDQFKRLQQTLQQVGRQYRRPFLVRLQLAMVRGQGLALAGQAGFVEGDAVRP